MARETGSLMPPKHILNAPTRLMRDLGYGKGYVYDHGTEEGFSGQNYFPDGDRAPRLLPAERARLRARGQEAARLLGQAAPSARRGGADNDRRRARPSRCGAAGRQPARLDRWFRRHYPALGHGRLEKLLRTGQVRVDGKRAQSPATGCRPARRSACRRSDDPPRRRPRRRAARAGRRTRRCCATSSSIATTRRSSSTSRPGLAVQGGSNTERHVDGLLDGLRFGNDERPRLVHRLDKDTSGVLLIARTAAAAAFFTRAFRDKTTRKIYWAIVAGLPKPRAGADRPGARQRWPGRGRRARPRR